ncbi:hypothetical protein [Hymenobacter fodinae]|uniref:Uncharacterized protein n=1 Tax=Hymenobacter fodinae TaxID=2510796 RepID=A0A4Z0P3L8_9BACT|nr:hypothetical protein [Hymenobacter fodinae]TGE06254.1 hypothetical protein EU556_15480 [Hymenobacter fodinae]
MKQLFEPQTYKAVLMTLWIVSIPMAIRDSFGDVASLCAAVLSAAIALGLAYATVNKSNNTKLLTLTGSVVIILVLMGAFVTGHASPNPSN